MANPADAGTPAWATAPRGDHPLRTPEYMNAAAAYGNEFARGTQEPVATPGTETLPTAPRKSSAGLVVVLLLGVGAAIGGFFLVQQYL